ncbi:MAG: deoxynucleoside kinase [Deltaproteobacteria bacterium]|nr:deoxynucleoside kinase [Deltaproteobacteria bacterium]
MFIGISGIIGAGKTTLTEQLAELLGYQSIFEPVEENPYLDDFYEDTKRWSFSMQIELLSRRFDLHQRVVWSGGNCVQDRTIYEDTIFAKVLYDRALMDERDYSNYMRLFNVMRRFLVYPDIIIFLDVAPEIALERINSRGRQCEREIPLTYLQHLDSEYRKYIDDIGHFVQVLSIDWSKFQEANAVAEKIAALRRKETAFFKNVRRI